MKVLNNSRGYTLVIVLVLIVLILSISAVFLRGAISNAKQEQRVDKNHLSVVASEMGVDYFSTEYTNRYFQVRDQIWQSELNSFYAEIRDPDFKGSVSAVAEKYRQRLRVSLKNEFSKVNVDDIPSAIEFKVVPNTLEIDPPELASTSAIYIIGKVAGEHSDGKQSILDMKLKFDVPSVLGEGNDGELPPETDGGDNGSPGKFTSFTIPNVETVLPFTLNDETKSVSQLYGQTNPVIRKKGDLQLGQIQDNKNSVTISATGDFQSSNVYGNDNVEIRTNEEFHTGQIQNNKGQLTILSKDDFQSGSLYGNKNVTIKTNGDFQVNGQVDANKGFLTIHSTDKYQSNSLSNNDVVQILTNGDFQSGLIEQNKSGLLLQTSGKFQSGNLQYNDNVRIEAVKGFEADVIIGNTGSLSISTYGEFDAKRIQDNKNVTIQTKDEFDLDGILYNNDNISIYAKKGYESKKAQNNTNLTIWSDDDLQIDGELYGNKGATLFSKKKFQTKLIQDNTNLKIVTLGDFQADNIFLKSNSIICAAGDFQSSRLEVDNTSHVYLIGNKKSTTAGITYLDREQWKTTCSVDFGPEDDEEDNPGTGAGGNDGWKPPEVDVEYN